ncbi:alpha/beta fold hydrolase [Kribbella sp. NPDC026596]|uniref:alpha/beta fold hydrolase n=1 Tax=Kribbella sp. NPDC026596 TaxID=3155122 RepID=UPI0033F6C045
MKLFVAEDGPSDAPPVLFIHGHGGGYHFQRCQADLLSQDLHLIAPDQRGVLRSGPPAPGEPFNLDVLLADSEELREDLGSRSSPVSTRRPETPSAQPSAVLWQLCRRRPGDRPALRPGVPRERPHPSRNAQVRSFVLATAR